MTQLITQQPASAPAAQLLGARIVNLTHHAAHIHRPGLALEVAGENGRRCRP